MIRILTTLGNARIWLFDQFKNFSLILISLVCKVSRHCSPYTRSHCATPYPYGENSLALFKTVSLKTALYQSIIVSKYRQEVWRVWTKNTTLLSRKINCIVEMILCGGASINVELPVLSLQWPCDPDLHCIGRPCLPSIQVLGNTIDKPKTSNLNCILLTCFF